MVAGFAETSRAQDWVRRGAVGGVAPLAPPPVSCVPQPAGGGLLPVAGCPPRWARGLHRSRTRALLKSGKTGAPSRTPILEVVCPLWEYDHKQRAGPLAEERETAWF